MSPRARVCLWGGHCCCIWTCRSYCLIRVLSCLLWQSFSSGHEPTAPTQTLIPLWAFLNHLLIDPTATSLKLSLQYMNFVGYIQMYTHTCPYKTQYKGHRRRCLTDMNACPVSMRVWPQIFITHVINVSQICMPRFQLSKRPCLQGISYKEDTSYPVLASPWVCIPHTHAYAIQHVYNMTHT